MVVQLKVGDKVVKEVEIVIAGDASGDGKITITDMLSVKSHMLNKTDLEGASGAAADVSGDGNISITDFIQIKAHILGKSEIKPAATEVTTETRTAQNIEQQTIAVTAEPDREEVSLSVTLLEVDCVCTEFLVPGKKTSLGLQVYHKERYV